MIKTLSVLILSFTVFISCNTAKKKAASIQATTTEQTKEVEKTIGKISLQYAEEGCAAVIIVENPSTEDPMVLIPKDPIPDNFLKDGLKVYFNFRLLKMPNPPGCKHGIPAEILDISMK